MNIKHQWEPEVTLEETTAFKLVKELFPELIIQKIKFLGAGWDNTAFLLNDELIFRFPRREIAVPLLIAEWQILPNLKSYVSIPIPIPKWRGTPTSLFPWPFIGYKKLSGFTACHANLSEKEREALAEPIAKFLTELHQAPKSILSKCQIYGDNHARIDSEQLLPKIMKNLNELALLGLLEKNNRLETLVMSLQNLRPPNMSVIVHGDFYVRHLLVDALHKLTGVIDFGDVHFGDPAIDLAIAHSFLPLNAHAKFRETYGDISNDTWDLAKLRAIFTSTYLTLYGYHSKDLVIMQEGLRSLRIMSNADN